MYAVRFSLSGGAWSKGEPRPVPAQGMPRADLLIAKDHTPAALHRLEFGQQGVRATSLKKFGIPSANSFTPFPAPYQSAPLNSSNLFCPTACFRAFEIAMYTPVKPLVAISHLVFSGMVSILAGIEASHFRSVFSSNRLANASLGPIRSSLERVRDGFPTAAIRGSRGLPFFLRI